MRPSLTIGDLRLAPGVPRFLAPPAPRTPVRRAARGLVVAAFAVVGVGAQGANQLNGIRLHDAPDSTRVVLDTRAAASYKTFAMTKPDRLVVDIRDIRPRRGFKPPSVDSKVVRRVRVARRGKGNYRVVLDLRQPVRKQELVLKPIPPYGHRLVLDLYPAAGTTRGPAVRNVPATDRQAVVAIDAGHGGEDPGAIGVGAVYEKRVVLAIAREIKRRLDAAPGIRGELVRGGDYYVPLRRRIAIARERLRADVFVSIHADAFRLASVQGASVYALSERGATSEEARWLAAGENRADLMGGVDGQSVSLDDMDAGLATVLVDIAMNAKMASSLELGEAVLGALAGVVKLHKRRVEQAGFVVLKAPDIPSVLIETGYLSNPAEARRLASPAHQRRVGGAIATGIQGYLLRHPPPDTLLATMDAGGTVKYVIKRGDTLSEIAARNGVSLASVRALNGLVDDRILIGQVLLIPAPGGG